jgi:hypothetical protein
MRQQHDKSLTSSDRTESLPELPVIHTDFPPENGCDRNDSWEEIGRRLVRWLKTALLLLPFRYSGSSD